MTNYNILSVEKVIADDSGKLFIFNEYIDKFIEIPRIEFDDEIIVIAANPIDRRIADIDCLSVIGHYSDSYGPNTVYFIKPYKEESLTYYQNIMKEFYSDQQTWIPFLPENKLLIWSDIEGNSMIIFKDISFNKDWKPITHKFYVDRRNRMIESAISNGEEVCEEYIVDNLFIEVEEYRKDLTFIENNKSLDEYYTETYATERFDKVDNYSPKDIDEIWESEKLLLREMLYTIRITTYKNGKMYHQYEDIECITEDWPEDVNNLLTEYANKEQRNFGEKDFDVEVYKEGFIIYKFSS